MRTIAPNRWNVFGGKRLTCGALGQRGETLMGVRCQTPHIVLPAVIVLCADEGGYNALGICRSAPMRPEVCDGHDSLDRCW